jgi:hypothetical protein
MSGFAEHNREILRVVAHHLGPLVGEVVFVGGQVAELLVTSPAATRVRPTKDVDLVVQSSTRTSYRAVEEALRGRGFRNDTSEGAPLCRWRTPSGLLIDVMPDTPDTLGFSNRWYSLAIQESIPYRVTAELEIRIPPAPVFLGTKWEAFTSPGREGAGDYYMSHDLEDIITVVAGRGEIIDEVTQARLDLKEYLSLKAAEFLRHPDSGGAVEGALPDARLIPGLIDQVFDRFRAMTGA